MINKEPECCSPLGELKSSPNCTIFYQLPWILNNPPTATTSESIQLNLFQRLSSNYVVMPFDVKNQWTQTVNLLNSTVGENRIKNFDQLVKVLKSTNPSLKGSSLNILSKVISEMNCNESQQFYDVTLPFILSSALQLTRLIDKPIPTLKQKVNHSLFFNQQQLSSILANCFLGTFPKPDNNKLNHFTFQELFSGSSVIQRKAEKLKCIFNYFHRVAVETPKGNVTFQRRYLAPEMIPDWSKSEKPLKQLIPSAKGRIEVDGKGMIQVDFAHKLVGGKTLSYGMVQEEVRFVINPELIVSMLFTEKMLDNEAITIIGTEQFNSYSGYSDSFTFAGNFVDSTPLDSWGRRYCKIVAIDAAYLKIDKVESQYWKKMIDRELVKSYVGFMEDDEIPASNRCAIATGNWGCGVYRGDPQFKSLIQWISASMCLRDVVYFTFGERRLANMKEIFSHIQSAQLTTGQLYELLVNYGNQIQSTINDPAKGPPKSVFEFIVQVTKK